MNKRSWTEVLNLYLIFWQRWLLISIPQLLIMMLFRLMAVSFYSHWVEVFATPSELAQAFWIGFKFDVSTLCYLLVPPFLIVAVLTLISRQALRRFVESGSRKYFLVSWLLLVLCLACDLGYYSYFQDHLNVLVFAIFEDDTRALLLTFWKNYPLLKFLGLFMCFGWLSAIYLNWIYRAPLLFRNSNSFFISLVALAPILVALGARGSLGLFPLSVQDTVVSANSFINYLSYNGFHAGIRALRLKHKQSANWNSNLIRYGYTNPAQAYADYFQIPLEQVPSDPLQLLRQTTPANPWAEKIHPHVLVIMMESFGSGYLDFNSPEFDLMGNLKIHFSEDFLFKNFLPSHGSTIGSLSSFMISAPQKPDAGFLTETDFLQVPFRSSAARVFQQAGYESHFTYGGNPGWRDINKFAKMQGFDHIEGDIDIEKDSPVPIEKHDWGVYDEDLFSFIFRKIEASKSPQFFLAMTTTNHPPYQLPTAWQNNQVGHELILPANLKGRLTVDAELAEKRFRVYQYANHTLGAFISRLKNSPLKDKLILAVTGDHSFWMINFSDQEFFKKWGVPFYLYVPLALRQDLQQHFKADTFGSHMDILPTLYPLAMSQQSFSSLGTNLFTQLSQTPGHWSISSNQFAFAQEGGIQILGDHFIALKLKDQGIIPSESSTFHDKLFSRYKGLMGIMDSYLNEEKEQGLHLRPSDSMQKAKQ